MTYRLWRSSLRTIQFQSWTQGWNVLLQITCSLKRFLNWPCSVWPHTDKAGQAWRNVRRFYGVSARIAKNYQIQIFIHFPQIQGAIQWAKNKEITRWDLESKLQMVKLSLMGRNESESPLLLNWIWIDLRVFVRVQDGKEPKKFLSISEDSSFDRILPVAR